MGQIEGVSTSHLDIAYEVSGPAGGIPVVCAHGWPDSPLPREAPRETADAALSLVGRLQRLA